MKEEEYTTIKVVFIGGKKMSDALKMIDWKAVGKEKQQKEKVRAGVTPDPGAYEVRGKNRHQRLRANRWPVKAPHSLKLFLLRGAAQTAPSPRPQW